MRPRSPRLRVAPNHKLLLQTNLDFDPRAAPAPRFVGTLDPLADQPLDSILLGLRQQRLRIAFETRGEMDGITHLLEQSLKNALAAMEGKLFEIAILQIQNVEHIVLQCAA